jgi:hypothetical protein
VLAEKQAVRRDDAGAAELDGANLVAIGVVDVRIGHHERDPEMSGAVDRRGADERRHQRHLAFARSPLRPRGRLGGDERIDLQAADTALEYELPVAIVFLEHGLARLKHEKESA